MKLSQRHQATFDEYYPNGYDAKEITKSNGVVIDESDYYHIMYIDILPDGTRTRDVPCVQKYSVQDWVKTKKIIDGDHKLIQSDIRVTGHDEYAILHDPTAREAKAKPERVEVKPGAKTKGRPSQNN